MPAPTADEIAAKAVEDAQKEEAKPEEKVEVEAKGEAPDPNEAAARADGWRPKTEYTGDPEKWVDAKTWVEKGPLLKRISSQSAHIKELKKTVDAMATHFNKNVEVEVKRQLSDLKSQKKEAIEAGDVAKVDAIDKQIDDVKSTKADIPTGKELPQEIKTWLDANPWYMKDRVLNTFAKSFNEAYLVDHPGDLEGSLRATTEATKKAFPDKFPSADNGKGKEAGAKVATVEAGGVAPSKGKAYTASRLTADQKLAHDQYIKAGTFKKSAEAAKMSETEWYVRSLEEIGELVR